MKNIKKITLCFFTSVLFFFSAKAQTTTFQKLYGAYALDEYLNDIIEYSQGGYVTAGVQYLSQQNGDIYLLRTDANGNQLWAKTFGDSLTQQAWSVKEINGGDLLVAGTTRLATDSNHYHIFILKTDNMGTAGWMNAYSSGSDDQCSTLEKTSGGFIIGGAAMSTISSSVDACLIKINTAGTILWDKIYQVNSYKENLEVVKSLPDGSILFAGYSTTSNPSYSPGFLAKTDSTGNILWWHYYTTGHVAIHGLDVLQDGSVMMCGEGGNNQMLLLKTDSSGNLQWAKAFGTTIIDGFFDIRTLADGNVLLSGYTFIVAPPNIGNDMVLIKCDTSGNFIWTRNVGENYDDQCYGLIVCSDGGFALCGETSLNSISLTIPSIPRLIKTDSSGFTGCNETIRTYNSAILFLNDSAVAVTSSSNFSSSSISMPTNNAGSDSTLCLTVGIQNENALPEKITYYPNPVENTLHVDATSLNENSVPLAIGMEIYDAYGKKVFASKLSSQITNNFNVSKLAVGIYFLKIKNGKTFFNGKIIKL